jgi:hypothetical protein
MATREQSFHGADHPDTLVGWHVVGRIRELKKPWMPNSPRRPNSGAQTKNKKEFHLRVALGREAIRATQPIAEGRSGAQVPSRFDILTFAFESETYRSVYLTFCWEVAMRRAILVSVLVVFGCSENTKELGSKAKDIGSKAKDVAKEVGTKVKEEAKEIGGKVKEEAKEIGGKVKEEAKEIGSKVKDVGAKVGEKVKEVGKDVKEKAKDAADKIKGDK